jgi:hypothetical protein
MAMASHEVIVVRTFARQVNLAALAEKKSHGQTIQRTCN